MKLQQDDTMNAYKIVRNSDANDFFVVEGKNREDALYDALAELGWRIVIGWRIVNIPNNTNQDDSVEDDWNYWGESDFDVDPDMGAK